MEQQHLAQVFTNLAVQAPVIVVLAFGLATAASWYARHPNPAMLTIVAVVILLGNTLVMTTVQTLLPSWWTAQGRSVASLGSLFMVLNVARSLFQAAAYLLLLLAVFQGRPNVSRKVPKGMDAELS